MERNSRTSRLKRNIIYSFIIKGWSGLIQLLIVPATLFCLGNYENGIWMTISSILLWIDSMDIGLGNGLRNQLSKLMALGKVEEARRNVSSTLFILIAIIIPVAISLICAVCLFNVYDLLNVEPVLVPALDKILIMCIALVSSTFVFKFIGNVYLGLQMPAVNNALVVGGQTMTLLGVYLLNLLNIHSLFWVALSYTLSPLAIYLLAYPYTFYVKFPKLRPSLTYFSWSAVKELLSKGIQFFILQIAGVLLFASSNAIISNLFSPEMVTPYQIAYRYFSFTMMVFTVIAVPYWSATTDAYAKSDYDWIEKSMVSLHKILCAILIVLILMVFLSRLAYSLWVGEGVDIPLSITIVMACYMFIIILSLCYSYFLNGIGTLRLQMIFTSLAAVAYFPVAWLLSREVGVVGIPLALCLVNVPGVVINIVQYNKIMNHTARGIWLK